MNEIDSFRAEIDLLDNELLLLLGKRFVATRRIGEIKKLNNFAATDELRLSQLMQSWKTKAAENKIDTELAESILGLIHHAVVCEHKAITHCSKTVN